MDDFPELEVYDEQEAEFVDFTEFLTERGLSITTADKTEELETIDGTTNRVIKAEKWQINGVCHALKEEQVRKVYRILHKNYVTVRYLNPEHGRITATMLVKEIPSAFRKKREAGNLWDGISFTLIER